MDTIHGLYQSNSNNKKTAPTEDKQLKASVSSPVKIKKASPAKKFISALFGEDDAKSIKDYIIYDVIAPAIRSTIVDSIVNAVQMTFYGNKGVPTQRSGNRTYISYNGFSSSNSNNRTMSQVDRARHDFDTITIRDKGEAEDVLTQMISCIESYGSVSVSDFYSLVGIESTYIDKKWGWFDLSQAYIYRVRDGYIIKLPKAVLVN